MVQEMYWFLLGRDGRTASCSSTWEERWDAERKTGTHTGDAMTEQTPRARSRMAEISFIMCDAGS